MLRITMIALRIFFTEINATHLRNWKILYENELKTIKEIVNATQSIFYDLTNDAKDIVHIVNCVKTEDRLVKNIKRNDENQNYISIDSFLENALTKNHMIKYIKELASQAEIHMNLITDPRLISKYRLIVDSLQQNGIGYFAMKIAQYCKFVEIMAENQVIPAFDGKNVLSFSAIKTILWDKLMLTDNLSFTQRNNITASLDRAIEMILAVTDTYWNYKNLRVVNSPAIKLIDRCISIGINNLLDAQERTKIAEYAAQKMNVTEYVEIDNLFELIILIFKTIRRYVNAVGSLSTGNFEDGLKSFKRNISGLRNIVDRLIYFANRPGNLHKLRNGLSI